MRDAAAAAAAAAAASTAESRDGAGSHHPTVEPAPGLLATVGRLLSFAGGSGAASNANRAGSNASSRGSAGFAGHAASADEEDEEAAAAADADSTPFLMRHGGSSRTDSWHNHGALATTGYDASSAQQQPFSDRLASAASAGADSHSFAQHAQGTLTSGAAAMPRGHAGAAPLASTSTGASHAGNTATADFGGPIDFPSLLPPHAGGAAQAAARAGARKR